MDGGTLYVVATPIGNLEDLSPRAQRILTEAAVIACEDTRHTQKLLSAFGIRTPRLSLHQHNEEKRIQQLLQRLCSGDDVALVSDAGTPLISDPGMHLVSACHKQEVRVVPIPGPSASIAALSASGLPGSRFLFLGFPPRKMSRLREFLRQHKGVDATRILFLAPHRLLDTLAAVLDEWGDVEAFLIREISKIHESGLRGSLGEVVQWVQSEEPQGEYCLAVAGTAEDQPLSIDVAAYVHGLVTLRGLSRSAAARQASAELGIPRRDAYREPDQDL